MKSTTKIQSMIATACVLLLCCAPQIATAQTFAKNISVQPKTAATPMAKTTATPQPAAAPATQPATDAGGLLQQMKFVLELGGQVTNVDGRRPSKFEETRQVREGFLFRRLRVSSNPTNSPAFFRLIARGAGELDQRYLLDFGSYGRFHTTVEWQGLPHLYSRGSRSLFSSTTPGVLAVADQIQQTLQATAAADLPNAVRGFLNNSPFIDLRVKRQTLKVEQRVNLTNHWSARVRFNDQKRFGTKPLGTGSYERIGTATGDTFRVISLELPEPVNHRSQQVTLGTSYVRQKWAINLDYTYSKFNNRIPLLTFENPFRATDLQATGTGGVFDRAAFARGIYALAPDNHANSIVVSGFVDLPHDSRWASALGWSFWRQDETFAPYTLNSAIVATGLPTGTSVTDPRALPRASLNGEVDIFTQDHLFATRLSKRWTANLHYRSYLNDNKTHEILFPGYAAYGESYWRTNISGKLIENEPLTFRRQTATAEAEWNISKPLNLTFDYKWEGWNRRHRQVGRSNEYTVGTQLSYRHSNALSGKASYHYSDRSPRNYDPGILEYRFLRMFDQAKRLRHDVNTQWQYHFNPTMGISGTFGYVNNDYDQNFFGVTRYAQGYGSLDFLYMGVENTTFYANYSRDHYRSSINQIAKTAVPFDLNNRWNRDERDAVDSFGLGLTAYALKEKFFVDAHYALAFGKTLITTVNPGTPLANSVLNATAAPFPEVKTRFHELNLDTSYQFTPHVGIGMRYIYEPYRLNDFAWDNLSPYPVTTFPAENDGRRFLLLDSQYSSYTANTFAVYLRFTR